MILDFVFAIVFGIAGGFGLRYLGAIGQLIVWLIMLLQAGGTGLVITAIIVAYRDAKRDGTTLKMPFGGLIEWAVMFTYFTGGVVCSYWLGLPWSMRNTVILGIVLIVLTGAMIVFVKGLLAMWQR